MQRTILAYTPHWNDSDDERDIFLSMPSLLAPIDVQRAINHLRHREKMGVNTDDAQSALTKTLKKYPHLLMRREQYTDHIVIVSREAFDLAAPLIETARAENRYKNAKRRADNIILGLTPNA